MNISVLGAGWLGLPLAKRLQEIGHRIKGSTTSIERFPQLQKAEIEAFHILFDPDFSGSKAFFDETDVLVLNIPPRRREDVVEYHTAQISAVIQQVERAGIPKVLFVSSTSVYPELNREVSENDAVHPTKASGQALIGVENMLRHNTNFQTTIVRFAGLVGPDRKPGRFFAGKKDIPNGQAPVNMIHQDDCIGIIEQIIQQEAWGEVFNGVADAHPQRMQFYAQAANLQGFPEPVFKDELLNFKVVSGQHVVDSLGYRFVFSNPMNMI